MFTIAREHRKSLSCKFPRLAKILADSGYRGDLANWILDKFGWELEVVLRPDECPSKFKVIPKRWIVERSFAWLENFRRLTIDYEYPADTAETMVQLAFCKIMLNKFSLIILKQLLTINPNKSYRFEDLQGITLHILVDFFRIRFSDSVDDADVGEGAAAFFVAAEGSDLSPPVPAW